MSCHDTSLDNKTKDTSWKKVSIFTQSIFKKNTYGIMSIDININFCEKGLKIKLVSKTCPSSNLPKDDHNESSLTWIMACSKPFLEGKEEYHECVAEESFIPRSNISISHKSCCIQNNEKRKLFRVVFLFPNHCIFEFCLSFIKKWRNENEFT